MVGGGGGGWEGCQLIRIISRWFITFSIFGRVYIEILAKCVAKEQDYTKYKDARKHIPRIYRFKTFSFSELKFRREDERIRV